ncbi:MULTISPECIES: relaxase/mobilization nuclease domain-containing protein [unclassified Streptomyces]|uniref:relaxase/mobilization nuclease domain-containing protein n=1 Tax=unclassified Streptomyces TaxID=2593676 RepID=UPI000D1AC5B5|nr:MULTISPECIES: relaxase/mobilization nuclease domain-containing protein [unclassified Streptomyces]
MIPRIHKQGGNTIGLLHYLYGRGTHEEHVDPHLVASFDGMAPDPGRDPAATKKDLQHLLDQPLRLLPAEQRPDKHVWHCSVRAAPGDRTLTDAEWGDIARRIVAATGIDPGAGCRWAAIRHADDHIHIIATLVREDGRRPDHHRSGKRAQAEARHIEIDYDLHRVASGDGTAVTCATSAERHKADRRGQEATSRDLLREHVHQALAGATDETEFFDRLTAAGVRVKKRLAPSGDVIGYSVAMVGDRNKDNEPIWYSGSTLAPDLSLPRILKRFDTTDTVETPAWLERRDASAPIRARHFAAEATNTALTAITSGEDDGATAAHLIGVSEVIHSLAQTSHGTTRAELRQAARAFERATRSHIRAREAEMHSLRRAARQIIHSGPTVGRSTEGAATALLLDLLILTAIAAARWHRARSHAQQAEAAQRTADRLRAAYQATTTAPLAALRTHGARLPHHIRQHHASVIRHALPHLADRLQTEPGWPALLAMIDQAHRVGHNTPDLLTKATEQRELHTAESISQVLVWRLYHLGSTTTPAHRPAPTATPASHPAPAVVPHQAPQPRRR